MAMPLQLVEITVSLIVRLVVMLVFMFACLRCNMFMFAWLFVVMHLLYALL